MAAQDPENAFVRYGLAQELAGQGRCEEAVVEFRKLIENDPNYCYAYFHCGRMLEKLGRIGEARSVYERGIAASSSAGDEHARSELEAALAELGVRG